MSVPIKFVWEAEDRWFDTSCEQTLISIFPSFYPISCCRRYNVHCTRLLIFGNGVISHNIDLKSCQIENTQFRNNWTNFFVQFYLLALIVTTTSNTILPSNGMNILFPVPEHRHTTKPPFL